MPVPKRKKSRARSRQGRAHLRIKAPTLVACRQCGAMIPPHRVCSECGTFKGRPIIPIEAK